MKAYQAYAGNKYGTKTANTPKAAAIAFFSTHPSARKCNIVEGESDGAFFTVRYGRASQGEWPQSWKEVTRKTVCNLPGESS